MSGREFDVIIFGATSYTAKLCLTYLFNTYGPSGDKIKYALAGRDRTRIEEVIKVIGLPSTTPIRVCPLMEDTLRALARECNVLINFVGPFASFGEIVVKACIEESTNYVDSSGEIDWCHLLTRDYQQKAVERGVKILPCMGFDYTTFDMGMAILHHASPGVWSGADVICTSADNTIGFSHGTLATILRSADEGEVCAQVANSSEAKKRNFFLIPKKLHGIWLTSSVMGPGTASYLEWLNTVYLRGLWSNGNGSGAPMNFMIGTEKFNMLELFIATIKKLFLVIWIMFIILLPPAVRCYFVPPSAGHGAELPADGFVTNKFRLFTKPESTKPYGVVNMNFLKGECYVLTGVTCLESALTIVNAGKNTKPDNVLLPINYPESGGVGSGSTLLGDCYRARLENAGIVFDVTLDKSAR